VSSYAWNCKDEDGNEIVAVGIDNTGGLHLFCAGCLSDILANPHLYEEEGYGIHGTHILSPRALDDLFGADC
jgi:hypothetical protein